MALTADEKRRIAQAWQAARDAQATAERRWQQLHTTILQIRRHAAADGRTITQPQVAAAVPTEEGVTRQNVSRWEAKAREAERRAQPAAP